MRLRMRLRTAAGLAMAAALAVTAGCGGGDGGGGGDDTVTLRFEWWGNPDRAKLTEQAIDLFEQRNPTIKIQTSYAEFDAYFQKMATQIAGGSAPDVLQMDYRFISEYGGRNVLLEFGTRGANVNTSQMNAALLEGGKVNGRVYGIPMAQNTQMFIYDPAAWRAAGAEPPADGWTWRDMEDAAAKVSADTGNRVRGVVDFGGIEDWFEVWLRQRGKVLYTADGRLGYTAADVAAYWQQTDRLRRSGAATQADVTTRLDGSQANDPVAKQTASSGFAYDSAFTPETFEIFGREMALAPFPSDGAELGQYAKPSMLISIARRSEHPREAARFIDFLLNDPAAGKVLGVSRGMPVNGQIRQTVGAALTGPPKAAYEFEQAVLPRLKNAPPPPPKGSGEVKAAFQRVYDDVSFERSSPQEAAEKFFQEAQQALSA
jgi:multiple sugar transport system substrate-binding protein